jgi:hypothetical protein
MLVVVSSMAVDHDDRGPSSYGQEFDVEPQLGCSYGTGQPPGGESSIILLEFTISNYLSHFVLFWASNWAIPELRWDVGGYECYVTPKYTQVKASGGTMILGD